MKVLSKKFIGYHRKDLNRLLSHFTEFSENEKKNIERVADVIPFRVNNYVLDELIDWDNIPDDPMFRLTFPQREMLLSDHQNTLKQMEKSDLTKSERLQVINQIRMQLNPQSNGQRLNIPHLEGDPLPGIQHKYRETVLFFPSPGQTCHAYCTFCFRWPQFTGMDKLKFGARQSEDLTRYLSEHPEVTDVLITGGDPMIMKTSKLANFLNALLEEDLPNLQSIRIGTKSLSYWPYRYLSDPDTDELLQLFERVVKKGLNLAFMAHFNHPAELKTLAVQKAIRRIQSTGAIIRTQSPMLRHINDDTNAWIDLWKKQVKLGMVPYYMFVARDTGASHYFEVPLVRVQRIYKEAYKHVSGLARTVRGPSMSTYYGKIQLLGTQQIGDEKVFVLQFLQARDKQWNQHPFFARYSDVATWLTDLEPAFGKEKFFFEEEKVIPDYN